MQPQQFSQAGQRYSVPGYDPRDNEIHELRTGLATIKLQMMTSQVDAILDKLSSQIVIDKPRDTAKLIRMSQHERDNEIQFMLATRRQIDPPVPPVGVPIEGHFVLPHEQGRGGAKQMSMSDAAAQVQLGMAGDPTLGKKAPGPANVYDQLMDVVRNRGRGESPLDAYETAMAASRPTGTVSGIR